MRKPLITLVVSLAMVHGAMAVSTLYVVPPGTPGANPSGEFNTWATAATNIADAVASAQAGDTILVSNGLYALSATIEIAKGITLQSFNKGEIDRDGTILDGQFPAFTNRCLHVSHANALIDGFTITNGFSATTSLNGYGGGIYLENGRARNCRIVGNRSDGGGGGVYLTGVTALLADSIVCSNRADAASSGGGIYLAWSGIVTNSVICNNRALYGGGVVTESSYTSPGDGRPALLACVISNNVASVPDGTTGNGGQGGGVKASNFLLIDRCIISHNQVRASNSETYGAGAVLGSGSRVLNSTIAANNNVGTCYGGGLSISEPGIVCSNCCIRDNAASYGGGVYMAQTALLVDSQVFGNSGNPGGAFMQGGSMRNTLVAFNQCGIWGLSGSDSIYQSCTIASNSIYGMKFNVPARMENCIVYANGGSNWSCDGTGSDTTWTNCCTVPLSGGVNDTGNIADDPLFVNLTGFDFGLRGNSPCIDKGVYRDWMAGARDLAGGLRIRGEAVDMGAFEYLASGTVLTVR